MRCVYWVGVEPVPVEVPSNHLIESSLDVTDETKPQQQQPPVTSESRQTPAAETAQLSAMGRRGDGVSSRAEYVTSPTGTPVANGLIGR